MIHIFVDNFFCVACIIFALTIFKGMINRVQMLNYIFDSFLNFCA